MRNSKSLEIVIVAALLVSLMACQPNPIQPTSQVSIDSTATPSVPTQSAKTPTQPLLPPTLLPDTPTSVDQPTLPPTSETVEATTAPTSEPVTSTSEPSTPSSASTLALDPNPPTAPIKLIFIHHSTGGNWLADPVGNELGGDLGRTLMDNNYFVSATNYGWQAGGEAIGDRTDIGNWWEWFRGPSSADILPALYAENGQNFGSFGKWPRLTTEPSGENQIIMFKSCYPNSNLQGSPDDPIPNIDDNPLRGQDAGSGDHTLANAKGIYNDLLAYFATRQDKLFIVITAPPVLDPTFAGNARLFNTWLTQQWLAENNYSAHNVVVWDFYNTLTGLDNHHRYSEDGVIEYITDQGGNITFYPSGDEHPSQAGNQKAAAEFVPWLNVMTHCWQGDGGCP